MLAIVVGAIILFLIAVGIYAAIDFQARREVKRTPKIPMAECPKHGMFAKKYMLELEIPPDIRSIGLPLKIEQCPFCFDERMKNAESLLKGKKKDV